MEYFFSFSSDSSAGDEKMAKEVVQHSHLQLALMKEALEDAVQAENVINWRVVRR